MKVYIACSLTHVPRTYFVEYTNFIHSLAGAIAEDERFEVRYALVDSDPQLASKPIDERARLCYLWDSKMVHEADVVVAECSFPSTGLGIELQLAVERETPILVVYRDYHGNQAPPATYTNPDQKNHELQIGDGFVSLMVLGLPTLFNVHQYDEVESGIDFVLHSLNLLHH